jgi:hypothetical protein
MESKYHAPLKRSLFMLMFGAVMTLGLSATLYAQGHDQKYEKRVLKDHQRQERSYNGNGYQTRAHQKQERRDLKYEQRAERNGYHNNGGYNNGGYYGNNGGSYGNDPYHNNRRTNGGYYGNNGGYYDPYYNNRRTNGGSHGNGNYNRRPH